MDKELLTSYHNNPAWAEVMRIYSGLFDTQNERETFILDLADSDILLAAECKMGSIEKEDCIYDKIALISLNKANSFSESGTSAQGLLALLELNETDKVITILQNIENPNKIHKTIVETIIQKCDPEKALDILIMLNSLENNRGQLFLWAAESCKEPKES